MDNSGTEVRLNPPLRPPPMTTTQKSQVGFHSYTNSPNFYVHYPQYHSPNPFPDRHRFTAGVLAQEFQPVPPGVDPMLSVAVNPIASTNVSSSGPGNEALQLGLAHSSSLTFGLHPSVALVDYQDPSQNVVLTSCGVNLHGAGVAVPSTATQNLATANPHSGLWTNQTIGSRRSNIWKKASKKNKIVQSVWCEVCGIDCNSKDVLDTHKLGKKHKSNLEKLISANKSVLPHSSLSACVPSSAAASVSNNPVIGTQENRASKLTIGPQEIPVKADCASSQIAQKKAAGSDDLETKRKKVVEGGAAADAVRTCAVCNVVCNSETVFRYHLQGQKHASKANAHAVRTCAICNIVCNSETVFKHHLQGQKHATKVKQHSNATRLATETK